MRFSYKNISNATLTRCKQQTDEARRSKSGKHIAVLEQLGGQVDFKIYASLLRQSGNANAIAEGKQIHAHISRGGYDRHTFLGNHLVQMYGKCECLVDAWMAFEKIRQRNVFSWNIMVAAYANNGCTQEARGLFEKMPQQDVVSWNAMIAAYAQNGHLEDARAMFDAIPKCDAVSWNTMIAAYAQRGHLLDARSLFDEMPDQDTVSWNAMITGYAQNGHVRDASTLFDEMPQPDLVSWNAMIAAYAQNGHGKNALDLFVRMDLEGVEADEASYVSALDACGALGALLLGQAIHVEIESNGFQSNVVVGTALVTMFGKCRSLEAAQKMFDEMPERNIISWNAMITSYSENGKVEEARRVFDSLPGKNAASWNAMISGYAQNRQLQEAKFTFDAMLEKDVVSWNAMIAAYAQAGHGELAIQLFKAMELEGMQPNKVTFVSVVDACDSHSALEEGKIFHALIADSGFEADVVVGSALVIMYGKCGRLEQARSMFDRMPDRSWVTWNAMIAAYAQNGHGNEALEFFKELNLEGMQPDEAVFNSILFACSHGGMLGSGCRHFMSMSGDYSIAPNVSHFLCMVDLMGRAGQLEIAEDLINRMPFDADALAWTILLSACKSHNDVELGVQAARRVLELDPENAATYVLLSNIYSGVHVIQP